MALQEIFISLGISFVSVFTAELGDKTQLFSFLLGTYFSEKKWLVLLSVFTGMSLVTALGFGISSILKQFVNIFLLQIIGGGIFILIGSLTLGKIILDKVRKDVPECEITEEEEKSEKYIEKLRKVENPVLFVGLLSLLFVLMELGDKSQIMIFCLFIDFNGLGVYLGAITAFLLLNGLGIFVASLVRKWCEDNPIIIRILASTITIALGLWMILSEVLIV